MLTEEGWQRRRGGELARATSLPDRVRTAPNATAPKSFVDKKVAITSIPYSKISSVSVVSNKNWAGKFFSTSTIAVGVAGQTYEVEFRGGADKAHHAHNVILSHITSPHE